MPLPHFSYGSYKQDQFNWGTEFEFLPAVLSELSVGNEVTIISPIYTGLSQGATHTKKIYTILSLDEKHENWEGKMISGIKLGITDNLHGNEEQTYSLIVELKDIFLDKSQRRQNKINQLITT